MPARAGLDTEAVVRAAARMADEQGLEAVTLGALAARLGIRAPSLYNHVAGLGGLRDSLAVLALRELGERVTRAAIGKSADEAILAIGHAYRAFAREHPGLFPLVARAPTIGNPVWEEAGRRVVETVLAVLAAYHLSEEEALHAVRALRSLLHGFAALEAAGGFGLPLDQDASLDYGLRLFARGLRAGRG